VAELKAENAKLRDQIDSIVGKEEDVESMMVQQQECNTAETFISAIKANRAVDNKTLSFLQSLREYS
jgi:DNA-binding FrmR family transcriptional regulator